MMAAEEIREEAEAREVQKAPRIDEFRMVRGPDGRFLPQSGKEHRRSVHKSMSIRELAKPYTQEALITLLDIMRNKDGKAKARDRLHAAEVILAYAWGRPAQLQWADNSPENPLLGYSTKELHILLYKVVREAADNPTIDITPDDEDDA